MTENELNATVPFRKGQSSLRQDAGDAQWKAPMAPRIPAPGLPVADLYTLF